MNNQLPDIATTLKAWAEEVEQLRLDLATERQMRKIYTLRLAERQLDCDMSEAAHEKLRALFDADRLSLASDCVAYLDFKPLTTAMFFEAKL